MVVCFQAGQSDGLPDTTQDFVQFFESVETAASAEAPYPGLADAIQALAATYPDAKFAKYRVANGLYHIRYDAQPSAALPANFAACGDSGLKLNPIFGQVRAALFEGVGVLMCSQGCSKAAMEAACLDAALRGVRTSSGTVPVGFAHQVMKAQVARTRPMFDVARWMGASDVPPFFLHLSLCAARLRARHDEAGCWREFVDRTMVPSAFPCVRAIGTHGACLCAGRRLPLMHSAAAGQGRRHDFFWSRASG
jgi:hypothetical protein